MMLNPQQFQQLPMFMPTQTLVNDVHKGASNNNPDGQGVEWSPRDQWAKGGKRSLRQRKLRHGNVEGYRDMIRRGESPPIPVTNLGGTGKTGFLTNEPMMEDGHHRLAHLEDMGHTEVPVEPRFYGTPNLRPLRGRRQW